MATAAVILSIGGIAYASDGNKAFLDQSGDGNAAAITQQGTGRNRFGSAGDHASQDGAENVINSVQSGKGNRAGNGAVSVLGLGLGGDARGIDQTDNGNRFDLGQSGNRNRLGAVQQNGYALTSERSNVLKVDQQGRDRIGSLIQKNNAASQASADANRMVVDQLSSGNGIAVARQVGHANTLRITQEGSAGNRIGIADQGLATAAIADSTNATMVLKQEGGDNTIFAAGQVGNGNSMRIRQTGNWNSVDLASQIGPSNTMALIANGDWNMLNASQTGGHNDATVRIRADNADGSSDGNSVALSQTGIRNIVQVTITGDGNGKGLNGTGQFTGDAASVGLDPGMISQGGLYGAGGNDNDISLTIDDASHSGLGGTGNLFAFEQKGSHNTIEGKQFGDRNQVAVQQQGWGNGTYFTQVGSFNVIGVKQ